MSGSRLLSYPERNPREVRAFEFAAVHETEYSNKTRQLGVGILHVPIFDVRGKMPEPTVERYLWKLYPSALSDQLVQIFNDGLQRAGTLERARQNFLDVAGE